MKVKFAVIFRLRDSPLKRRLGLVQLPGYELAQLFSEFFDLLQNRVGLGKGFLLEGLVLDIGEVDLHIVVGAGGGGFRH